MTVTFIVGYITVGGLGLLSSALLAGVYKSETLALVSPVICLLVSTADGLVGLTATLGTALRVNGFAWFGVLTVFAAPASATFESSLAAEFLFVTGVFPCIIPLREPKLSCKGN